jgi:phytoene synthase
MNTALENSYARCREYTRRHARNFYYAFRVLPPEKRNGIYAVYAFCQLSDAIVDQPGDLKDKERRLEEWRRQFSNLRQDSGSMWLFPALADTMERFSLPAAHFLTILDGMAMDLTRFSYETFDDLYQYAYRVASVVGLLSIEIFGYTSQLVKMYAKHLGIALQLTNIIRDVAADAAAGRIYLPQEDLEHFILPDAVRVYIVFADDNGHEYPFVTAVLIPMTQPFDW